MADAVERFIGFVARVNDVLMKPDASGRIQRFSLTLDATVKHTLLTLIFLSFTSFTLLLILSPLYIQSEKQSLVGLGALLYTMGSFICHQLPQRSFALSGVHLPICARDVGMYVGWNVGMGLMLFARAPSLLKSKKFLVLSVVPLILDGVTQTILDLRESSNMLRMITGLAFGFGLACFLVGRLLDWMKVTKYAKKKTAFAVAVLLTIPMLYGIIAVGAMYGTRYVSKDMAVEIALNNASKRNWGAVNVYYISPLTPYSLQWDPYVGNYRDVVLEDLRKMEFPREKVNPMYFPANKTDVKNLSEAVDLILSSRGISDEPSGLHGAGLWVVVLSDGRLEKKSDAVFLSGGPGEYYYIDALTGEIVKKQTR